ncbi:MAG: protein-glutamine glutaminase family protein [Gammaproteobacteria bacterium]
MFKKLISISLLTGLMVNSVCAANPNSAYRAKNQDWHIAAQKHLKHTSDEDQSIVATALSWNPTTLDTQQKLLNNVPVWPNYQTIKEQFEYLKTHHYLIDPMDANIKRIIPWRYPLDYCFERAAAAVSLYNNQALSRPAKVFAFGNLELLSAFGPAPDNILSFWYHVAPVIRDKQTNTVYVLDPSLNLDAPLPLESWLKQLVELSHDRSLKVNICNGFGAVPQDVCSTASATSEKAYADELVQLLSAEWDHLQSKGINAQQVLTDDHSGEAIGNVIYGAIALNGLKSGEKLKSQLAIQYKLPDEATWNTLLDVSQAIDKINSLDYFTAHPIVPIGSIFAKANRANQCQCSYHSCHCALPPTANKIELRMIVNGNAIKQCTYQYPTAKNLINQQYIGPDIHYRVKVNSTGEIDLNQISGEITGCS